MYIEYRSIADLNEAIIRNLHIFPHDVDLIVGIPRSGMLPANLLALYLNKPFSDIDSFMEGRVYSSGRRGAFISTKKTNKVLIVDDSILAGNALLKVREKLLQYSSLHPQISFQYGVIYASQEGRAKVDFYCEIIEGPRLFQWNLFHQPLILPQSILDIDGVLCPNPPVDDDGVQYLEYIKKAPTLYTPTVKVDKLVSCRLEKYREVTEEWLAKHHIQYNELYLLDLPTKEERIAWGKHGIYKGNIYKQSDNVLFIESSLSEAQQIFQITHRPVFCIENFQMINDESSFNRMKSRYTSLLNRFKGKVVSNVIGKYVYSLLKRKVE